MNLLALETSCDDTCAAILGSSGDLLSSVVSSQDEVHGPFQGVVPELASRRHCEDINAVLEAARRRANLDWVDLDAVAVTDGPGLIGSLLTGIAAAKSLSATLGCPLIPVNHIEAHVYSILLENRVPYPYVCLVASGGHTALFQVDGPTDYTVLGHTLDDAAGEAYDKVAKMLDLGYPGGPEVEALAREGNPAAFDFPRPTLRGDKRWNWHMDGFEFSFSGIKTAVYYRLRDEPDADPADVAASFQRAVNDVLVYKTLRAANRRDVPRVVLGGGVAANGPLRRSMRERGEKRDAEVFLPSREYCTDNAAMVALRATMVQKRAGLDLNARPRLSDFTDRKITTEGAPL